jgi:serine/threonine protein kinase/tetratricopeptide (TPR) repeat protein
MSLRDDLQAALGDAYTVERELGGGGMSRLFVCEEVAFGRKVAVKVLAPELAAGVSAERFQREIKLAAQLQHPNIVPVHTAGEAAGLPYYSMPFVDGLSLRGRLERNAGVPMSEALGILKDVARALAYAHDHGVVHRDIKPENILLADEASVVTDFGIAKALHAAKTDAPGGTLTQVGTSMGTPAYMAPEQIAGDPATDHRADIYSFGCVAYEVLTGAAPFAHRQPHQLFAAHMGEKPAPLVDRRPDCPPEITALVTKCLEKDPANRPQSARELLRALDSTQSYSTPVSQPAKREFGGRKLVIGAIAGIAIFSAVAALAFRNKEPAGSDVHSLAVLPFENVGGDSANAYFADGIADELTTELSKVPGLSLASRTSAFRYRESSLDIRRVADELDVGKVVEGTVSRSGNRLRLTAQLTDASNGRMLWTDSYQVYTDDLFAVQDSLAAAIVAALRVRLAGNTTATGIPAKPRGTDNLEAYDLYLRGRHLWARRGDASLRQAMELFRQAIALDPRFARAHAGLAMAASVLPMYADVSSDSIYPVGIAAGRRAIEIDPTLADGYLGLGNSLAYEFKWDETERNFKRAIQLEPDNATAHHWYGSFLSITGRLAESITELQEAVRLDPLSAVMRNELGGVLGHARRFADAERELRRSAELDSTFIWVNGNLSGTFLMQNEIDSAMRYAERAGILKPVAMISVLTAANRVAEAQQVLTGFRRAVTPTPTNSETFLFMHAAARNTDSTLYWLNRAIDVREGTIFATSMSCNMNLAFLEGDPRYYTALARMNVGKCRR